MLISALVFVFVGCASGIPSGEETGEEFVVFILLGLLCDAVIGECIIELVEGVDVVVVEAYIVLFFDLNK